MRRAAELALVALGLAGCAPRMTYVPPPAPAPATPPAPPAPAPEAPPPRTAPLVRVGLLVDTDRVELGSDRGLLLESADGQPIARVLPGAAARLSSDGEGVRLQLPGTDGAAGEIRGLRLPLVALAEAEGTVTAGGVPYRGAVLVQRASGGGITVVNRLDLESYLLGVVPRELGRIGPELLEAAKAQAVAARTYAVKYLGRRGALGFDVFASTQDQVYGGLPAENPLVSRAVRATDGEILTYGGEPIEAYYHSTCAGRTAAIDEVWAAPPQPYLRSVVDVSPRTGLAYDSTSSRFRWTERWSAAQLRAILNRTLADSLPPGVHDIGEIRDMQVTARTTSGRVRELRIRTSGAGTLTVGRDRVRWILLTPGGAPLNSSLFDVRLARDAAGRVTEIAAQGGGWGHGIGMCQIGAMGRAREGQDYRTILKAYYPGAELRPLY